MRRIRPYTVRWEREANNLARDTVQIFVCVHCGHPVIKGYCCGVCGSNDPGGTADERKAYFEWVAEHVVKKQNVAKGDNKNVT